MPLTAPVQGIQFPRNSISKTKDDLKNMLLSGLDDNKALSESQQSSSAILPRAADTTDGSAGFNSGGDVADITSDGKPLTTLLFVRFIYM